MRVFLRALVLAVLLVPWAVAYRMSASTARIEVQAAADAAALAGAAELMDSRGDTTAAIAMAQAIASGNSVSGQPAILKRDDIEIDIVEGVVTVRIHGATLPVNVPILRLEVSTEATAQARAYSENSPQLPPKTLQLVR